MKQVLSKLILSTSAILLLLVLNTSAIQGAAICTAPNPSCPQSATCQGNTLPNGACDIDISSCESCPNNIIPDIFGKITPPDALKNFLGTDKTGAAGIGKFLSNLIVLIYTIAMIVLIFMLLWGAFEWLTSGGDKEAVGKARSRIISAIIGIILFAVAFAIIQVLGQFTGFKFFVGQ